MIYREDDWKAEVEVLKNMSDDKYEKHELRVIKTIRKSRMYKTPEDGHIFEVMHLKGSGYYCGRWSLTEDGLNEN